MILEDVTGSIRITPRRASSGGVTLIRLEVRVGDRTWATDDPGLEPNDLRALGRWLRTLSKGRTPKELVFLEPNLRFECVRSGQLSQVRVWFEGEARPEWAPYETWDEEDLWLDIEVPPERLASAAEALINELNRAEA